MKIVRSIGRHYLKLLRCIPLTSGEEVLEGTETSLTLNGNPTDPWVDKIETNAKYVKA